MTPAEQKERNFKLSKVIIDYYGPSFFRGKKILDLGSGNGEFANIFAKLGASITCCDARQENLDGIRAKYPHIHIVRANLEEEFPFQNLSYDLVFSIDLLCHLKNYHFHLDNMMRVSENIVLETEILDSSDPNSIVIVQELKKLPDLSFSGEGVIPSDQHMASKLAGFDARAKRIDETKLNDGHYRYDWRVRNTGRKPGNRRLWFIRKDQHFARILKQRQEESEAKAQEELKTIVMTAEKFGAHFTRIPNMSAKTKRFVIVIPSYKNERWCEKNILSALNQKHKNFRILFVDDASPDRTFELVKAVVEKHPNKHLCKLTKNSERLGALHNLYDMIHSCDDDEICVSVDGDDWLADDTVLMRLQNYYNTNDVWITHGQYKNSTDGGKGVAAPYPDSIKASNSFRNYPWGGSHLRTFYTWLFKLIKKEDLFYKDKFFDMTWDLGIILPLLELSGTHSMYIDEILYVYNMENEISDHRKDVKFQQFLDGYIRRMPRYQPIKIAPPAEKNIGLFIIATGKYDRFIDQFIDSADRFFLNNPKYNVHYYIFTDKINNKINTYRNYTIIPVKHEPFPAASMNRFKFVIEHKEKFVNNDYLTYCDVDSKFVGNIDSEILSKLTTVQHCGYVNKQGPFETNEKSTAYIDIAKHQIPYMGGGFQLAEKDQYFDLCQWCYNALEIDKKNNIKPIWDDESILQKYLSINKPEKILDPGHHYPESNLPYYKKIWGRDYEKKIILLEKNHLEVRGG